MATFIDNFYFLLNDAQLTVHVKVIESQITILFVLYLFPVD